MNDMIVNLSDENLHHVRVTIVFKRAWQFNKRLNLEKCTFVVKAGKFHIFYLTKRGIKEKSNKYETFIRMAIPTTKKKRIILNGMLRDLNIFISELT